MLSTPIQELMDENLPPESETKEWNWQAMSTAVNTALEPEDRPSGQLKQIGRDNLAEHLIDRRPRRPSPRST